jgi:hypothetical protein
MLKEKHDLRVFDNMVLRRIFGPKREEAARDWRRLCSDEFCILCISPGSIRMNKG